MSTTTPAVKAYTHLLACHFTRPGETQEEVFNRKVWTERDVELRSSKGEVIFAQNDVEFPADWSDDAVRIVASKYFKGPMDSPLRETSLKQVICRVVNTFVRWGLDGGYYSIDEADIFQNELTWLVLDQRMAWNSPVWFNTGIPEMWQSKPGRPQCSACFINSVEDTMEGEHGILSWFVREGKIFKDGSGSGASLSKLRSSREFLSSGGRPSGPVSFMKTADANAGQIKSGGKTRRAAKMVILDVDHGDVIEFIEAKAKEEEKAKLLIEQLGYSSSFDDPEGAYASVWFQNANHSLRVNDDFMRAVEQDKPWFTKTRKGEPLEQHKARDIFRKTAQAAWRCGDPGMQYDTMINLMNPVAERERINSSNPCSEYMFVDDSACNLASLNLLKFFDPAANKFDVTGFEHSVRMTILSQEIIVDRAGYPTPKIEENSKAYRPLGLGYCNLGALLMVNGLPYDSHEGRYVAAALTSFMGAAAYCMSSDIAAVLKPFQHWDACKTGFSEVIQRHSDKAYAASRLTAEIDDFCDPGCFLAKAGYETVMKRSCQAWETAYQKGQSYGFRNAQVTLLAPTGTIGFMMDAATTGVEPELGLLKYKTMVGGGYMMLLNPLVPRALAALGYSDKDQAAIVKTIEQNGGNIFLAPELQKKHYAVFDTSFTPAGSARSIAPMGHVKMMAAVQPFLSGAISKTCNVPNTATVEDFEHIYMQAWKLGLKAIAIYRDGCKNSQPLSVKKAEEAKAVLDTLPAGLQRGERKALPETRPAFNHRFRIGNFDGYMNVGLYDDGKPAEIFINMSKEGSMVSGLANAFAIAVSLGLQWGVPLEKYVEKFSHMSFEPAGFTGNPLIGMAKSIPDYIFRWLQLRFASQQQSLALESPVEKPETRQPAAPLFASDAPPCSTCGGLTVRKGACYGCLSCGGTSGCS